MSEAHETLVANVSETTNLLGELPFFDDPQSIPSDEAVETLISTVETLCSRTRILSAAVSDSDNEDVLEKTAECLTSAVDCLADQLRRFHTFSARIFCLDEEELPSDLFLHKGEYASSHPLPSIEAERYKGWNALSNAMLELHRRMKMIGSRADTAEKMLM